MSQNPSSGGVYRPVRETEMKNLNCRMKKNRDMNEQS